MSGGHKPITRQRSEWVKFKDDEILGWPNEWWERSVHDGRLIACIAEEPAGWHISISFRNHRQEPSRYPTWDEQVHAVRQLLPTDLTYVMVLPPDQEYVALHETTFHWHEHPERDSWAGLMELLDRTYPADVFRGEQVPGNTGGQIVALLRRIDELRRA